MNSKGNISSVALLLEKGRVSVLIQELRIGDLEDIQVSISGLSLIVARVHV